MRGCGRRARSSLLDVTTATPASLVAALADLACRLRRLATVGCYDRLLGERGEGGARRLDRPFDLRLAMGGRDEGGLELRGRQVDPAVEQGVEEAAEEAEVRAPGRCGVEDLALGEIDRPHASHAVDAVGDPRLGGEPIEDRKSTRLNSSHVKISYAVFC